MLMLSYQDEDEFYVPPAVAARIADQIGELHRAGALLSRELDAMRGAGISLATVRRLEFLAERLRPTAYAGAELAGLRPELLNAGLRVWRGRAAGGPA